MIEKKRVSITGRLLFPLKEGRRAVIVRGGDYIHTSLVVEILESKPDHVLFETMNSVYRVTTEPVPNVSVMPDSLRMCA